MLRVSNEGLHRNRDARHRVSTKTRIVETRCFASLITNKHCFY
ncbi:MAG: hypothetical protein VSS75_002290 [Candidatus Parabeggiatoa sp.]|nr:hypothetical protein [Candidatus Parabeggiatoa sp.]